MKKLLTLLAFLIVGFSFSLVVNAEETVESTATKKYKVTFPIEELGGCTSIENCKEYCADSAHKAACVDYATRKGFYNKMQVLQKRKEFVEKAKNELGCSTEESCKELCYIDENTERCHAYAAKYGKVKYKVLEERRQIFVEKAQETLGCDGLESCKEYCSQEENKEKCQKLSKSLLPNLPKLNNVRVLCDENPEKCAEMKNNAQERLDKCKENPEECKTTLKDKIKPVIMEKYQKFMKENKERSMPNKKNMEGQKNNVNDKQGEDVKGISTERNIFQRLLDLFLD